MLRATLPGRAAPAALSRRQSSRRATVVVRAEGVQDLLARDRKEPKLNPALLAEDKAKAKKDSKAKAEQKAEVLKSRSDRRSATRARNESAQAELAQAKEDPNRPKRCKEALDRGLALFQDKKYSEAIALFNLSLELPGNGAYRLQGSPREYSCPSDAEEQAALYNMACAYAQMGQAEAALTCLEAVLDAGFTDYNTMRTDTDLAPARGPKFEELMGRYDSPMAKLRKMLPGNRDQQVLVSDTNKPWVLW